MLQLADNELRKVHEYFINNNFFSQYFVKWVEKTLDSPLDMSFTIASLRNLSDFWRLIIIIINNSLIRWVFFHIYSLEWMRIILNEIDSCCCYSITHRSQHRLQRTLFFVFTLRLIKNWWAEMATNWFID